MLNLELRPILVTGAIHITKLLGFRILKMENLGYICWNSSWPKSGTQGLKKIRLQESLQIIYCSLSYDLLFCPSLLFPSWIILHKRTECALSEHRQFNTRQQNKSTQGEGGSKFPGSTVVWWLVCYRCLKHKLQYLLWGSYILSQFTSVSGRHPYIQGVTQQTHLRHHEALTDTDKKYTRPQTWL